MSNVMVPPFHLRQEDDPSAYKPIHTLRLRVIPVLGMYACNGVTMSKGLFFVTAVLRNVPYLPQYILLPILPNM